MGKSKIPFIFENIYLNKIFVEAAISKNISNIFYLQSLEKENIKYKKLNILLTDPGALNIILDKKVKINKTILITGENKMEGQIKNDVDVTKINLPFKINDIFQRIENNLIQLNVNSKRLLKHKKFTYDPSIRKLSNQSFSLRFTEKESQIFSCLIENRDSYISKKDLLSKVWSYGEGIDTHTLETHVYALRKKIETKLKFKDLIKFEEKKGYYLNKSFL